MFHIMTMGLLSGVELYSSQTLGELEKSWKSTMIHNKKYKVGSWAQGQ